MSNEVKRYDPINSDGTCGMCIEDADYGAYVEYADYASLEAELARVQTVKDNYCALLFEANAELAHLRAGQEPVAYITGQFAGRCVIEAINRAAVLPTGMALYAAPPPSAVPAGWKPVPVEPTQEIREAIDLLCDDHRAFDDSEAFWHYLLDSAPSAPKADDPVKQMLLEALNGMLLHIREPESESEFQWPEHFKKQKEAFVAARAAIAAAQEGRKV